MYRQSDLGAPAAQMAKMSCCETNAFYGSACDWEVLRAVEKPQLQKRIQIA